jgi:thiamine-phosphate diphosphorylase
LPPRIDDLPGFVSDLEKVLEAAPVAALQIRLKDLSDYDVVDATRAILPVAHKHGTALIMNDRVPLVKSLKLDGVHVGQDDMPLREARKVLGPDLMIGVTCHNSRHLAMEAAENGADYVAFGAFYPTSTRKRFIRLIRKSSTSGRKPWKSRAWPLVGSPRQPPALWLRPGLILLPFRPASGATQTAPWRVSRLWMPHLRLRA